MKRTRLSQQHPPSAQYDESDTVYYNRHPYDPLRRAAYIIRINWQGDEFLSVSVKSGLRDKNRPQVKSSVVLNVASTDNEVAVCFHQVIVTSKVGSNAEDNMAVKTIRSGRAGRHSQV